MPNYLQIPIIDSRYLDETSSAVPNGMKLSRHFKPGDIFFLDSSLAPRGVGYFAYNDDLDNLVEASIASETKNVFVINNLCSKYYFCIAIEEYGIIVPFSYDSNEIKTFPNTPANASTNATQTLNLDDYNCTLPVVDLSITYYANEITLKGALEGVTELIDGFMFLTHFGTWGTSAKDTFTINIALEGLDAKPLYRYDSPHTKNNNVTSPTVLSDIWAPIVYYGGAFYLLSNAVTFTGSGYTPPSSGGSGTRPKEDSTK